MAVLGSTSLTGCSSIPGFIATGTLMTFQQSTAPTSWTKQTTHDNKALRVVSGAAGSGGITNFTSVFTSRTATGTVDNTTLLASQIPSHAHQVAGPKGPFFNTFTVQNQSVINAVGQPSQGTGNVGSLNTGGGGAHSHTFTGSSLDFAVQYVDLIIASKDA